MQREPSFKPVNSRPKKGRDWFPVVMGSGLTFIVLCAAAFALFSCFWQPEVPDNGQANATPGGAVVNYVTPTASPEGGVPPTATPVLPAPDQPPAEQPTSEPPPVEQPTDTPVTEKRLFGFITDSSLREIIERDYSEIQRAYIAQCWKSVIILSGGTIEAILTDLLITNKTAALAAESAPKETNITQWNLSQLIQVAVELQLVSTSIEKLSHSLREYRNLVHPGNELRNDLRFDAEEARIAIEVLNIVQRDLSL